MLEKTLNNNWKMRRVGSDFWLDAKVPGSVYADLLSNNKMEDPYYRDNELESLKLMNYDYEYMVNFDVKEEILNCEEIILRFDGVDTIADIFLNNTFIQYVNNMHRIWELDVKKYLKNNNQLRIIFYSPTKFIESAYEKNHIDGTSDAMRGFSSIRKAHFMFGWDWGPRLPDAGIWRNVRLLAYNHGKLESVYIKQKHFDDNVQLEFDVGLKIVGDEHIYNFNKNRKIELQGFTYKVEITSPEGKVEVYDNSIYKIVINNPLLWWPNGYGQQNLYKVKIYLINDKKIIDTWEKRIGLRTLTISREKDQYGESFAHEINGIKIFAMGADYIPEDNILSFINRERTYNLLNQCKMANYNVIRVWGGGIYPNDEFYDICDEMGFIVWQDFMFACAVYELNEEFEENIKAELIDNIRRIRNHASLGLWCGNNEMEQFMNSELWSKSKKLKADYIKIFEYIIPKILKQEDPQTFYWPSSPSSGGCFDKPTDENRGDTHYWDVWHGNKVITDYREHNFRYLSEFGFQSFPCLKTIESFTEPKDRNIFSYIMEKHQRNSTANGKIMSYMEQTYLYPTSFDTLLYASQLLQAEAIRYGVEHLRRNRGRCMGTIVWQLNDCWPVASWSSIDYFGRWKALHYYEKRFFAPLLLSCNEEGVLSQDTNPNAQPYSIKKSIHLCVSNETFNDEIVIVNWMHRNNTGDIIKEKNYIVESKALSSIWLEKVYLPELSIYDEYVSYEMKKNNEVISKGTVIFTPPKYFKFKDPELKLKVSNDNIIITSQSYARGVEIVNNNNDLILSDNYFDMNKESVKIKVIKGSAKDLKVRSVYDIR